MKRAIGAFSLAIVGIGLSGCATLMSGTTQSVNVQTNPPGAICRMDGRAITTPADMVIHKNSAPGKLTMQCELAGFKTLIVNFDDHGSPWIWANIFNGLIVGALIDSVSGGAGDYRPTVVRANFEKN